MRFERVDREQDPVSKVETKKSPDCARQQRKTARDYFGQVQSTTWVLQKMLLLKVRLGKQT